MTKRIFEGSLVRLSADDPETLAKAFVRWGQDSEYFRMLDSDPPHLWSQKKTKEWFEKDLEKSLDNDFFFSIRTLEDNQLIGFLGMFGVAWTHGDAWVAIAIGERQYWGKGYGTDAMRVLQRYAFEQLNLHRLSLLVFGYNRRAIRSYEKAGFVVEGRVQDAMLREGRRWDWIYMGILKDEWLRNTEGSPQHLSAE